MVEWLNLSDKRKLEILNSASATTGLPENAIEKDWWVTLTLKAVFSTCWAPNLVFKGGTSLSKAWNIIERFSEDIDLALDREVLGFKGDLNTTQVRKLRKISSKFIRTTFLTGLIESLDQLGVDKSLYNLTVQFTEQPDIDPRVIELCYHSATEPNDYISGRVLIEIGARSLREPCTPRQIVSIIGSIFKKFTIF